MILSLLVALATGQLLPKDPPVRPRVFRSDGAERLTRLGGGDDLAFFEAFPLSGAGVGAVAPLPNWLLQSDALDTAPWAAGQSLSSLATITANATTSPITGATTADRVQYPATGAGAGSWVASATVLAGLGLGKPATCSAYIRGNGTSGTIDLCIDTTPNVCTPCAFTSAWAQCSTTNTPTVSGAFYIGNMSQVAYNGGVARSANDVFIAAAQCNAGSTVAPYVATTTAAMGFTPTGARGETLTFTRASTAVAQRTATGGLATTGIANGDLVLMPANQPRVEYDSNGVLGLLVESSRTNSAIRSQEFDQAAVWVPAVLGVGAPTVTANFATAPDGTLTADRVQFPATTAGQLSMLGQAGMPAVASAQTVYAKGNGTSGQFCILMNTATGNSPVLCSYNSSTWTRCLTTGTYTGAANFYVGNDSAEATVCNVGLAANDVLLWGAQSEAGTYPTSYIPTTTVAVTRAVEASPSFQAQTSFPSWPVSWASSVSSLSVNGGKTGYFAVMGTSGGNYSISQSLGATSFQCAIANTTNATKTTTVAYGTSFRAGCTATASTVDTVFNGVASGSPTAHSLTPYTAQSVFVGDFSPFTPQMTDSIISRVCVDPSPTRCR
jgi:hypothetical protein